MSQPPLGRDRETRDDAELGPGQGLTLTLWTIATLLAALELVWWWAERIYST